MPFGLVCASASFNRIMWKLIMDMKNVENFIDDINVYSLTFERHLQVLRELFGRLRRGRLTAKPSKCYLCFQSVECLGHIAGCDLLKPKPDKVQAKRCCNTNHKASNTFILGNGWILHEIHSKLCFYCSTAL